MFWEAFIFGILITKAPAFAPEGFDCREKSIKHKGASGEVVFVLKICQRSEVVVSSFQTLYSSDTHVKPISVENNRAVIYINSIE